MFLAVPNRLVWFDIALSFEAVPIRPLEAEAEDNSFEAPRLDIGRLEGGREASMLTSKLK